MATCTLTSTAGVVSSEGDQVSYSYLVVLDSKVNNPREVIRIARGLSPNPLPALRAAVGSGYPLYASKFEASRTSEKNQTAWVVAVTFEPPSPGEDSSHQVSNPLARPPVFTVRYFESEYVIKSARNVDDLPGPGFFNVERPAGTLGPIVNAAFRRPDEPPLGTERRCVIVISRNYQSLNTIISLNNNYQRTTNVDTVRWGGQEFSPRTLKYHVTEAEGLQVEDGVAYWPGSTEIEVTTGTDLVIDNVGFEYWDRNDNGVLSLYRAKDENGDDTSEPVNLTINGRLPADQLTTTQIAYRYLSLADYDFFFE